MVESSMFKVEVEDAFLFSMNFTLRNCNQNQPDMKKKNGTAKKTTAKKVKKFEGLKSTQPPPTPEQLEDAAKNEPTLYDLNLIRALEIKEPEQQAKPIIFSKIWYEFSQFAIVMNTHPHTLNKWLSKRWLAYSLIGKMRYINVADVEDMMLRFRRPALIWLGYLGMMWNDLGVVA